jgi:hypothetical protein
LYVSAWSTIFLISFAADLVITPVFFFLLTPFIIPNFVSSTLALCLPPLLAASKRSRHILLGPYKIVNTIKNHCELCGQDELIEIGICLKFDFHAISTFFNPRLASASL